MKLSDQVCSLAQAKRLKELGVAQTSLFYWEKVEGAMPSGGAVWNINYGGRTVFPKWSAYTLAELMQMIGWDYVRQNYEPNLTHAVADKLIGRLERGEALAEYSNARLS